MSSYHEITSADDATDDALPAGSGFLMVMCGSLLFWLFVLVLLNGA
ncbi:hypothetical protein [Sphingomonas sp.]